LGFFRWGAGWCAQKTHTVKKINSKTPVWGQRKEKRGSVKNKKRDLKRSRANERKGSGTGIRKKNGLSGPREKTFHSIRS